MNRILLSLGSNIEPRGQRLRSAISIIKQSIITVTHISSLYETSPVGYTNQESFLNLCLVGTTNSNIADVHEYCKTLELQLGRVHREMWREREIDIDIILFDNLILDTPDITIPHLRFRDRRFVLVPAAEIAPEMVDPVSGKSISDLLSQCHDQSSVSVVDWDVH